MNKEELKKGQTIFVVRPNTREDPLRSFEHQLPYSPILIEEIEVLSKVYDYFSVGNHKHEAFKAVGKNNDFRLKNPNVKVLYVESHGFGDSNEYDFIKAFNNKEDADKYALDLISDENIHDTMEVTLDNWGITEISHFIENVDCKKIPTVIKDEV